MRAFFKAVFRRLYREWRCQNGHHFWRVTEVRNDKTYHSCRVCGASYITGTKLKGE